MASTAAVVHAVAPVCAAPKQAAPRRAFVGARVGRRVAQVAHPTAHKAQQQGRSTAVQVFAVRDGTPLDRPLRVAVIGGGPSGACCAESLAKGGVEAYLIERKMDNCKVRRAAAAACKALAPSPAGSWQRFCTVWGGFVHTYSQSETGTLAVPARAASCAPPRLPLRPPRAADRRPTRPAAVCPSPCSPAAAPSPSAWWRSLTCPWRSSTAGEWLVHAPTLGSRRRTFERPSAGPAALHCWGAIPAHGCGNGAAHAAAASDLTHPCACGCLRVFVPLQRDQAGPPSPKGEKSPFPTSANARRTTFSSARVMLSLCSVTKMKMISPSNREVDVGKTLNEKEWIGMCRREVRAAPPRCCSRRCSCCAVRLGCEASAVGDGQGRAELRQACRSSRQRSAPGDGRIVVAHGAGSYSPTGHSSAPWQVFDDYLRKRATKLGANLINGLFMGLETSSPDGPITIRYNKYNDGAHARGAARAPQLHLCLPHGTCRRRERGACACARLTAQLQHMRPHASSQGSPRLPPTPTPAPASLALPCALRRRQGGHPLHPGGRPGDWCRRRQLACGQGH